MIKNTEIENLFSNSFNNYSVEPNNSAWEGIETNLNEDFASFEYKAKFNNYTYTPSSAVWNKIATKLWLNNFIYFSYNSFNIYYAASIIFALIGGVILFNHTNKLNSKISFNNKITNTINSNKSSNNSLSFTNKTSNNNNNNLDYINSNNIINNTNTPNNSIVNNNNNNNTIPSFNPEKTDSLKRKNSNIINPNNLIVENTTKSLEPEPVIITKYIKDTVIIRDTIKMVIRDTIFKDKAKDILSKGTDFSAWSIDAYYSPMMFNISTKTPNNMQENIDTSYSSIYNWSLGLNANYKIKNFNIQAGVAFTKYTENYTYTDEQITTNKYNDKRFMAVGNYTYIDKYTDWVIYGSHTEIELDTVSSSYELVEHQIEHATIIDTVWSYNIDSSAVIVMDSTKVIKYDTITAIKYDSVDVVVVDTIKEIHFVDVRNQYSYIEIPIMIGYEFNSKHKFSYVINAGLVTGIFINAKGKGITLSNEIVDLNSLPFMKLNLTGMATAGVHYKFTTEMSLILEATFRKNFTSIYKPDYFIEKRFNSLGLRIGVKYRF